MSIVNMVKDTLKPLANKLLNTRGVITTPSGEREMDPETLLTVRQMHLAWKGEKSNGELYDALRDVFLAHFGEELQTSYPITLTIVDECSLTLNTSSKITISDADALREVLGERFDSLVETKVDYKAKQDLIEMACDADNPERDRIAACLSFKTTPTASMAVYKVPKPAKAK